MSQILCYVPFKYYSIYFTQECSEVGTIFLDVWHEAKHHWLWITLGHYFVPCYSQNTYTRKEERDGGKGEKEEEGWEFLHLFQNMKVLSLMDKHTCQDILTFGHHYSLHVNLLEVFILLFWKYWKSILYK